MHGWIDACVRMYLFLCKVRRDYAFAGMLGKCVRARVMHVFCVCVRMCMCVCVCVCVCVQIKTIFTEQPLCGTPYAVGCEWVLGLQGCRLVLHLRYVLLFCIVSFLWCCAGS